MSLRWFHLFFISLSTLLFWGLGYACWIQYQKQPLEKLYFIGSIVGLILGVILLIYGILFFLKMKRVKS